MGKGVTTIMHIKGNCKTRQLSIHSPLLSICEPQIFSLAGRFPLQLFTNTSYRSAAAKSSPAMLRGNHDCPELLPLYDMPDALPLYKPTAVDSLGPAQNGSVFLPQYSHTSPRYWWEEAVHKVCQTSDPGAVYNALKLLPVPSNAIALLSKRGEGWLNTCLEVTCKRHNVEVPPCNSLKSTTWTIVYIITRRRSPLL